MPAERLVDTRRAASQLFAVRDAARPEDTGLFLWTTNACFQCNWAVRWDGVDITRLDDLLTVPPANPLQTVLREALAVSSGWSFIAGSHRLPPGHQRHLPSPPDRRRLPGRLGWTDETGTLRAISQDGSRLVGRSRLQGGFGRAAVWDPMNDLRFIDEALLDDHGIVVPAGYQLLFEDLIAGDGGPYTIVGTAITANGVGRTLWLARLGNASAVPLFEPMAAGGVAVLLQ